MPLATCARLRPIWRLEFSLGVSAAAQLGISGAIPSQPASSVSDADAGEVLCILPSDTLGF